MKKLTKRAMILALSLTMTFTAAFAITGINDGTVRASGQTTTFSAVSAGTMHTMVIDTDGSLWGWGMNNGGRVGNGADYERRRGIPPTRIGVLNEWTAISAGGAHTMGIKRDGSLWGWGNGTGGRLGNGRITNRYAPTRIGTYSFRAVSAGFDHTAAIRSDGTLWTWGHNAEGQLGDGTNTERHSPVRVGTANDWTAISAGGGYTMAVRSDGSLWGWGANGYGRLGDGTVTGRNSPVRIGTDNNWANVFAGAAHTVAIRTDGTLWTWGNNAQGQLGDGTRTSRRTPVRIGTASDWVTAGAGSDHTMAVRANGTLWGWGANTSGSIGDGTRRRRTSPVRVGTGSNWAAVTTGRMHTLALGRDGALWAWGDNNQAQLGNGTTTSRNTPVRIRVPLPRRTVTFRNASNNRVIRTASVRQQTAVGQPADPSMSGHTFAGWFTQRSGGSRFNFDRTITSNRTIWARFVRTPTRPAGLRVRASGRRARLSWNRQAGVRIEIQHRVGSGNFRRVTTTRAGATSWTSRNLRRGARHSYRIRAVRVINGRTVRTRWSAVRNVNIR